MNKKINGTTPPKLNPITWTDELSFLETLYSKEQILEMYYNVNPKFKNSIGSKPLILGEKGSELLIDEEIFKLV